MHSTVAIQDYTTLWNSQLGRWACSCLDAECRSYCTASGWREPLFFSLSVSPCVGAWRRNLPLYITWSLWSDHGVKPLLSWMLNVIRRQEISVLPPTASWLNKVPLKLSSTTIIMADRYGMVNPAIFEDLQARVDEDSSVRDVRNRPVVFELAQSKSTAGTSWDHPNVREARSASLSVLPNAYSRKQADQYNLFCPEPTQLQPQQVGSIFPLASYPTSYLTSSSPRRP